MANARCPFENRDIEMLNAVVARRTDLERAAGILEGLMCGVQEEGVVNGLEVAVNIIDSILQEKGKTREKI